MRNMITTGLVLTVIAGFFAGCTPDEQRTPVHTEQSRTGVSCEDESALEVLKSIVDKKFNGDYEIEKKNIVIWDYNSVGRYTCRAKIKKVGKSKQKKALPKDKELAMLAVMGEMFAPAQYGIGPDGGWINYYTYVTTASNRKNRHFYVEIFSNQKSE